MLQVRLGPLAGEPRSPDLSPEEQRLLGVFRRWADAVVIQRGRALIYEAALIPSAGDLGVMLLYRRLFPLTPEMDVFRNLPVTGRLLWGIDSPPLRAEAVKLGFEVMIWKPPWFIEYLETLRARERRAARA